MLANIADGETSKKLIVDNEDILKKLKSYMLHNNTALQVMKRPLERCRKKKILNSIIMILYITV